MNAADLPEGSIVAHQTIAWMKVHPLPGNNLDWAGTKGGKVPGVFIDAALAEGAKVLRVGDGG